MKGMKYFVITLFLTLSAFFAVMYSSCTKDACAGITCLNGGSCGAGKCVCYDPTNKVYNPVGVGGNNCEIVYKKLYAGEYIGITHGNPGHVDTTNTFRFNKGVDTGNFSTFDIDWYEPNVPYAVVLPAVFESTTPGGSRFKFQTTSNSRTYQGYGTVNSSSTTIYIKEIIVAGTDTTVNELSFVNFYKK